MNLKKLNKALKEKLNTSSEEELNLFFSNQILIFLENKEIKKASVLLQCYTFISNKIEILGVEKLMQDYESVLKTFEIKKNRSKENLQEIQLILEQSAYLFEAQNNSIPTILHGYLDEVFSENIKNIKEQIVENTKSVWLKSEYPNLINQQGELVKSIPTYDDKGIIYLGVSEDKNWIYTANRQIGVKIWNATNFRLVSTLSEKQKEEGLVEQIYDLQNNCILVKSIINDTTLLQKWNIQTRKILASVKYVYENQNYSIDESHKLEISLDKKWIASQDFKKGYFLIIRNTHNLEVVDKIKSNIPIRDFKFTLLEQRKKWRENIMSKSNCSKKQAIVSAFEIDADTTQLSLFSVNKKGKLKRKYSTKANGFYFDGRILITKDRQYIYFLSNNKIIEKHSLPKLEFLKSYTVLHATKEDWLENLIPLKSKEELLAFSKKGKVYQWNEKQESILKTENTFDFVEYLDISSKDYCAISNGIFKTKIFNLHNAQLVTEIYSNSVNNSFKHIQKNLLASCDDEKIHIWDISRKRKKFNFNSFGSVNSIFKLDNTTVFTGSSEGLITGFNKEYHRYYYFFILKISENINHITAFYEKEVCYLIVSCGDFVYDKKKIKIINLKTQEIVSVFEDHKALIQKSEKIPNSNYIVSISYDYTFRIWDYRNAQVFRTCFHTLNENFTGMSIGFEIIENYLITFSQEVIIISDTVNFDVVFEFPRHEASIESYTLSDCKTFFATGYTNGNIKVWSFAERKELFELSNKSNSIQKLYWKKAQYKNSKKTSYILSTDDTYLFLWDVSNKTLIRKFKTPNINDIAFFDGNKKFVIATSKGEVIIWDINKEKELFICNIGRAIMKIEIDEKERMIILGEYNGQIQFLKIQNEPKDTIINSKMF